MSFNSFAKNHPKILLMVAIFGCGLLTIPIAMVFGLSFNISIIIGISIIILFSITILLQKPSKEIEQFVKNISTEIVNFEKSSLGFNVKTKDFELIRIKYNPPFNIQETVTNSSSMSMTFKERMMMQQAGNMAGNATKKMNSTIGTDVLIFLFEIPKNQANMVVQTTLESTITDISDPKTAWHKIKQLMGEEGVLINSGKITSDDTTVFVELTFDRKTALEKSTQIYDTLKAVKNKIIMG